MLFLTASHVMMYMMRKGTICFWEKFYFFSTTLKSFVTRTFLNTYQERTRIEWEFREPFLHGNLFCTSNESFVRTVDKWPVRFDLSTVDYTCKIQRGSWLKKKE